MKKLTILLFSILISFNSYGEWENNGKSVDGNTFYIDIDTIKEHGGYVYYWVLVDYLKPIVNGIMSVKLYNQGDCGVNWYNRYKPLSFIRYKQPMGGGSGKTFPPSSPEWRYPSPDTIDGGLLKYACDYVK